MNYGNASESVYNRTVYKSIQTKGYHSREQEKGTELRADCALLPVAEHMVTAQGHASGKDALVVFRAAQDAANHIAGRVIEPVNVQITLQIMLPSQLREAKLRMMLEEAAIRLASDKIEIGKTEVQIVPELQTVIVAAFAVAGTQNSLFTQQGAQPNEDIVMTKWLGLEATVLLAVTRKMELAQRYPIGLIEDAIDFSRFLSVTPEAAVAAKSDVSAMQVVREGGIFGGLWELAQSNNVGLSVELKKILVKQETIEVCEYFDINPYRALSGGSLLVTTDRGSELVQRFAEKGIVAEIIGRTTKDNDRIIRNDEEVRYLEPAREDEYYKVMD